MSFVKINGPALGHDVTSLDPAGLASDASVEQVQSELANLCDDLSVAHEILSRSKGEQGGQTGIALKTKIAEGVDLSGITISKRTLKEICRLIEKDERYLEQAKNKK